MACLQIDAAMSWESRESEGEFNADVALSAHLILR
jgi:hypothetical protein